MTLKEKLTLLTTEFTTFKQKVINFKETKNKALTETNTKLQESNRKQELTAKENSENEKVLETLLNEMKEVTIQLNQDD